MKRLAELLGLKHLTQVVDIGASPIDGVPPYKSLLDAGLCQLTGFEPQPEQLTQLNRTKGANETYLPHVVSDGAVHSLQLCRSVGFTSLLEPDPASLALFEYFQPLGQVHAREQVQTRRLDDIEDIEGIDFLKIDIQGGELSVFQNGRHKLAQTVFIQTEVSFVTLYKDQPAWGEVDLELRAQGFMPHCFANIKHWPIAPAVIDGDPAKPLNQLLEADVVYIRDVRDMRTLSNTQLRHMALIAHVCYGSRDLSLRCLTALQERHAVAGDAVAQYLATRWV
jgi:FkbM family methyltransferase